MDKSRYQARQGMTLIEVLVVMSVIGLLVAIILPGMLSIRETQRKQLCSVRLKEIGKALEAFEGAHKVYPAAVASEAVVTFKPGGGKARWIAPHVRLLPYLDQVPLFNKIDLNTNRSFSPPFDPSQATDIGSKATPVSISELRLPLFICPSDSPGVPGKTMNNYRANLGTGPGSAYRAADSVPDPKMVLADGAFTLGHSLAPGDFKDGASHTITFSERVRGQGDPDRYYQIRDMYYSGVASLYPNGGMKLDEFIAVCAAVDPATSEFYPYAGATWFYASYDQTWYNHALPPNSPIPDCAAESLTRKLGPKTTFALSSARSLHTQGVNCVYLDGHTGFLSHDIDISVWRALASRAGAETTDLGHP